MNLKTDIKQDGKHVQSAVQEFILPTIKTGWLAGNADIMKKNKLLRFFSLLSVFMFVLLLISFFTEKGAPFVMFNKAFPLTNILIIHSLFLFNGLLFSNIKLSKMFANINLFSILRLFVIYILTMLVIALIFALLFAIGFQNDMLNVKNKLMDMGLIIIFLGIVIAPFTEELFFRAALLPKTGIVISALLFSLFHITYFSVFEIIAVFILGLVLGMVYKRWGIGNSILLHIMVNFVNISAMFILRFIL